MEEKVNFTIVGVFVLVLFSALIGGVLWLSSGKSYRTEYVLYRTYMNESVSGLNINAPVRYRGVEVGRVQQITLAPDNVEQVQLTLGIARGTPIKTDTVALLQTHGLTGLTFVELTGGSKTSLPLNKQNGEDYPVIKTGPSLMTRLDSSVSSLLANLNQSSARINSLLDEQNLKSIKHTLTDIETLTHTLAARQKTIDTGITDAGHTLHNAALASDELPIRIEHSAAAFERMADELSKTSASARTALNGAQQINDVTLPEINELVSELRDLTTSLRRMSGELEDNPGILVHGKTGEKRGPGE